MEVAGLSPSHSIFAIAQDCRSELRACTQLPKLVKSHWAYDRLSDFDLWDSGVGASTDQQNSLDLRLRDDDTSRKVVITSLSTLKAWTNLCRTLAQANSATGHLHKDQPKKALSSIPEIAAEVEESEDITLEEAQNSVEELQALLVKLGVAIRQAGRASRLGNADRSFDKHQNEEDLVELISHLTFILRLANPAREIVHAENGQPEERLDMSLIICRVNELHEPLQPEQETLVRANARRRYRFHYAKIRSESLGALPKPQVQSDAPSQATAEIASQAQAQQTSIRTSPEEGTTPTKALQQQKKVTKSLRSLGNSNQLSTHKAEVSLAKIQEDVRVTAPPTARAVTSDYPKAPKPDPGKVSMRCPYCHMTISSQAMQSNMLWRKHVSDDLQPYTCYLQDCPQGNCFFDSFSAWKAHVLSDDHQSSEWMCYYCDIENFGNVDSFVKHLHEMHEGEIVEEDLSDLTIACQTQESPVLDTCPICLLNEGAWKGLKKGDLTYEPKNKIFVDHIGDCLHAFALRALPLPEQDDQDATSVGAPKTPSSHESLSDLSADAFSDVDEGRPGITKAEMASIGTLDSGQSQNVAEWMEICQQSEPDTVFNVDNSPILGTAANPGKKVMTDAQIQLVAYELAKAGHESWSRIPRTYCVLKHIDELQAIDSMVNSRWSDLWIPLPSRGSLGFLDSTTRQKFMDAQYIVLDTPNTNVEDARHCHFSNTSDVPFRSDDMLGRGSRSIVDRVTSTVTSKQYARKRIPRPRRLRGGHVTMEGFTSELSALIKLQGHRHISRYVGSYTEPTQFCIITAPVADYSLVEYLDLDLDGGQRSLLQSFFGCLTSTLVFMHERRIRHINIKPYNVLIKNDQVFLAGFASNRDYSQSPQDSDSSGPAMFTPRYAAPELAEQQKQSRSADIWSLGCVFLEMWTVLCGRSIEALKDHLSGQYYRSLKDVNSWIELVASTPGLEFDGAPVIWITSMLQEDRHARPTAQELLDDIREHSKKMNSQSAFAGRCCLDPEENVHPSINKDVEVQSKSASKDMTTPSEPEEEGSEDTDVSAPPRDTEDWYQQVPLPRINTTGLTQRTEGPSFEPRLPPPGFSSISPPLSPV